MKFKDKIWCWENDICPKHLIKRFKNGIGMSFCKECLTPKSEEDPRSRLERLRKAAAV
jgi:hypothetical protein